MAHTVTILEDAVEGVNSAVYALVTCSGTYATGGEVLTAGELGLARIKTATPNNAQLTATSVAPTVFVPATNAVQLFVSSTGAEIANGVSLTGVTFIVRVLGV